MSALAERFKAARLAAIHAAPAVPDDEPETLGDVLTRARLTAGLSLGKLAQRAGVDISTVSRIEAGERQPSLALLSRLIAALDCTVTEEGAIYAAAGYPVIREPIDPTARALSEFLRDEAVPEVDRARVRQWVSLTLAMHRAVSERKGAA